MLSHGFGLLAVQGAGNMAWTTSKISASHIPIPAHLAASELKLDAFIIFISLSTCSVLWS